MISVREAKDFGVIPKEYENVIKDKCICGADYFISRNRKTLMCSDERCDIKNAYRGAEMLSLLGVKGMGFSYCYTLLKQNKFKSHIGILIATPDLHPNSVGYSTREFNCRQIQNALSEPVSFRTMVSKLAIPGLKENALNIFKGIDSHSEYMKAMMKFERAQRPLQSFVSSALGSYGDLADTITNTLIEYDLDIKIAEKVFNIIPDSNKEYKIAITGRIELEGNFTRTEFESHLREIGKGQISVRINKALASVDYVVCDSPSNSLTYNTGKQRNILITSKEFCDIVRKGVK